MVLFLERGSSFGYQNLVVDFTNLIEMKKYKESVVNITHATLKYPALRKQRQRIQNKERKKKVDQFDFLFCRVSE